jgi:hypothetical protein
MTPEPRSVEEAFEAIDAVLRGRLGTHEAVVAALDDVALLRSELTRLRGIEEAARQECEADLNCGVDCDCEYDDDVVCLAHRVLDALARPDRQEEGDG